MTDSMLMRSARRRSARMGWLMLGAASLAFFPATRAGAQTDGARTYAVNISAKPLPEAVAELSAKTGLQVLYTGDQAFQRKSAAVNGDFAPEQALDLMLRGTGVSYRVVRPNAVTLEATAAAGAAGAAPEGAIALDTVDVQGESPWGSIAGFVAHVSETATKTDTPIIETPQSINVVTRDQITTLQPMNVGQATRYEAGVTTDMTGADPKGEDYIEVRGFQASQYLDGLRVATGNFVSATYDPYMLQRIEILKGSSAALYGQSYPGGIVNLISKRPTEDAFREVQLQGGSYGRISAAFDVGGPIDPDKRWLYRVTGIGFNSGTQVEFTNLSRVSIAPALTYQPDASTNLTFLANFRFDPNAGFWNKLPALGTLLVNPAG